MDEKILAFSEQVLQLKTEFDRAFAEPLRTQDSEFENFVGFNIEDAVFVLRMTEIKGLVQCKKVIPLPSADSHFIGITGVQGQLIPVYSLASILGYSKNNEEDRWLVLCEDKERIGFLLEDLQGYIRILASDLSASEKLEKKQESISGAIHFGSKVAGIVNLSSIVKNIFGQKEAEKTQLKKVS